MAEKQFEDDDPMELVGSVIGIGEDDLEEMGLTFVEELARMDWSQEEILIIFSDPFYRGPHTVYRAKGAEYVKRLIVSVMGSDNPTPKPDGPGRMAEADTIRANSVRADFVPITSIKPAN
jgi:hypothetical protein